jgi:hypothetical protein
MFSSIAFFNYTLRIFFCFSIDLGVAGNYFLPPSGASFDLPLPFWGDGLLVGIAIFMPWTIFDEVVKIN